MDADLNLYAVDIAFEGSDTRFNVLQQRVQRDAFSTNPIDAVLGDIDHDGGRLLGFASLLNFGEFEFGVGGSCDLSHGHEKNDQQKNDVNHRSQIELQVTRLFILAETHACFL